MGPAVVVARVLVVGEVDLLQHRRARLGAYPGLVPHRLVTVAGQRLLLRLRAVIGEGLQNSVCLSICICIMIRSLSNAAETAVAQTRQGGKEIEKN